MGHQTLNIRSKYEPSITIDTKTKTILKMHCSCWNFANRRLKPVGEGFNKKIIETPCKHLKRQYDGLIKCGYKYREVNTGEGSPSLTAELRREILAVWGGRCSFYSDGHQCEETKNLQFHRLIRGHQGGGYSVLNTRPLCLDHHKLVHSREFQ